MLSKIAIFLTIVLFPVCTSAQLTGLENKPDGDNTVYLSKEDAKQITENTKAVSTDSNISEEDGEEVLEEDLPPPTTITPSEIAEIELESKKQIRLNIKKQNKKDRERFVDSMTWSEKNLKIQELMKNGKSYSEAKKEVEALIQKPQIDVKKDSELEKYIYQKGKFRINAK